MSLQGCKCKKSKCLKMYCECFAAGLLCNEGCKCNDCHNDSNHLKIREQAITETLRKNPKAFEPKIAHDSNGNKVGRHNRGCRCKKSNCLKRYCECFQATVKCTPSCRCTDCHNMDEGNPPPKTPDRARPGKSRQASAWPSTLTSPMLATLSPAMFSPGAISSPSLLGNPGKSINNLSLETDIFSDLTAVGSELINAQQSSQHVALTPTRFASTYSLESPMMLSFGGTPQRGTPQWAMKESPARGVRQSPRRHAQSRDPLMEDATKAQKATGKTPLKDGNTTLGGIAEWTLSPLDTCRFLSSPAHPRVEALSGAGTRSTNRRRLTPLKRKMEESGCSSLGGGEDLLQTADTPEVSQPAMHVNTVKRESSVQLTQWRSLPDSVKLHLKDSPCLARLQATKRLRDFRVIRECSADRHGVVALAELLWGNREIVESMRMTSTDAELWHRVLDWEGMPSGSTKESVADKYTSMLERFMQHKMRASIFRLLCLDPDVSNESVLVMFLVSPHDTTYAAMHKEEQLRPMLRRSPLKSPNKVQRTM